MNTATNPNSGEVEPCTRTEPPFFEHDTVELLVLNERVHIDTVDVDGDDSRCRVRNPNSATTFIVPVEALKPV